MQPYGVNSNDVVIGIAASGSTPYVIGAVREAKKHGILTACITCNPGADVAKEVDIPIVAVVGPEFVTGSTRMKSGTAQKLILNMISTTTMIRMGHVKGNKMVDMQLTNAKLVDRGTRMILDETDITDAAYAKSLLLEFGSVRNAVEYYNSKK
jgi:N-acetylmuramic acid 6-phosphate etherase